MTAPPGDEDAPQSAADADADVHDVRQLAGRRVLVVGDLVLDEYVTGRMTRISREAPVPIVEVQEKEDRAGSAASPAANAIGLGSYASIVGVIGCDPAGARLEAKLREIGVDDRGLVRSKAVHTSTKTRIPSSALAVKVVAPPAKEKRPLQRTEKLSVGSPAGPPEPQS